MSTTQPPTSAIGSGNERLASLLERCAVVIRRGKFDPMLYDAMRELHSYTGRASAFPSNTATQQQQPEQQKGNGEFQYDDALKAARSAFEPDVNQQHRAASTPAPSGSGGRRGLQNVFESTRFTPSAKKNAVRRPSGIRSATRSEPGSSTIGGDMLRDMKGLFKKNSDGKNSSSSGASRSEASTVKAGEWHDNSTQWMGPAAQNVKPSAPSLSTIPPNFQRPANPKSSILASGHIQMFMKEFFRCVWKEVLMSLVDTKRGPTGSLEQVATVLLQKQEGPVNGIPEMKEVAQIPVTTIDDVNSLVENGEFKFSIRVCGKVDEYIFRCRDADSVANWVVTILSAKEAASLKRHNTTINQQHSSSHVTQAPTKNTQQLTDRRPIKELRAIAHGEGINTVGMERKDLERIAADIEARRPPPPPPAHSNERPQLNGSTLEAERRKKIQEEQLRILKQQRDEQERQRQAKAHAEYLAAEERRRKINEKREADDLKRRQMKEAEQRAAEERRRQAIRNAQKAVEHNASAERARQDIERQRREAEMKSSQPHYQQGNSQFPGQHNNHYFPNQKAFPKPPPPQNQQHATNTSSPIQQKYSNVMKNLSSSNQAQTEQDRITAVKRSILGNWALNPPAMTMLKPIDQLLTTIHLSFPPAYAVNSHAYFLRWKPIVRSDLGRAGPMTGSNAIDEEKLKKAVKKLRFFLHPDKLPRDLDSVQEFVCKMS